MIKQLLIGTWSNFPRTHIDTYLIRKTRNFFPINHKKRCFFIEQFPWSKSILMFGILQKSFSSIRSQIFLTSCWGIRNIYLQMYIQSSSSVGKNKSKKQFFLICPKKYLSFSAFIGIFRFMRLLVQFSFKYFAPHHRSFMTRFSIF